MCGIVGAIARRNVVPILLEGPRRLEYRGYDSAGIAVVDGKLRRVRSTGRVAQLGRLVEQNGLQGTVGIARRVIESQFAHLKLSIFGSAPKR